MAKIEPLIRAELNPYRPVPEVMQIVEVMLQNNPGQEMAVLNGLAEAINVLQSRMKGDGQSGK